MARERKLQKIVENFNGNNIFMIILSLRNTFLFLYAK